MNASTSAYLGVAFAVLGTATVFLMFHLWGYPFDKATRTSAAPRSLMILHRVLGFLFVGLYVFMMSQMVPRLLSYQVEFPPRTVAHIMLGITIGFLLLVKVSIIRFFRHLEEWMPFLGTGILLCTFLLLGLSVPFAFRERALRAKALGGDVATPANIERVKRVLPAAGLPKEANIDELVTEASLSRGRDVLLTNCVVCHDLRTVLARPRSPKDWVTTVQRMAERPIYGDAIDEKQQWRVATYLVAITPELQAAARKAREQKEQAKDSRIAAVAAMEAPVEGPFDASRARALFESKCAQCHELSDCDEHAWRGKEDVHEVLERMVDNGLEASAEELDLLRRYLVATYVKEGAAPPSEPAVAVDAGAKEPPARPRPAAPTARAGTTASAPPTVETAAPTASAPPTEAPTCGKKPLPDCPMQAWMKANAAGVAAGDDLPALASVLERIARMEPAGYAGWAQLANDGASAARSGDLKGARASCSGCHSRFRERYKNERRGSPIR